MKKTILIFTGLLFIANSILLLLPPYVEFDNQEIKQEWGRVFVKANSLRLNEDMVGEVELRSTFWVNETFDELCKNYSISYKLLAPEPASISLRLQLDPCEYYGELACQKKIKDKITKFQIHDISNSNIKSIPLRIQVDPPKHCVFMAEQSITAFTMKGKKKRHNLIQTIVDAISFV